MLSSSGICIALPDCGSRMHCYPYVVPFVDIHATAGITYEEAVAKMDAMLQEAKTPRSYKLKPGQSRL